MLLDASLVLIVGVVQIDRGGRASNIVDVPVVCG
jgi:hypothetical protein